MILNFSKVICLVSELNDSILGWLCDAPNASRKDVAADRQHQGNQAGGMFGLLVSGDASNRH